MLGNLVDNPAPKTHFVHFRIIEHANENGPTSSQFDTDFQGLYLVIEQMDGQFLEEHDLPELVVHSGDEPWELGCPICNYHEYQARQSVGDLVDLDGVGEKTVEKLAAVGIESLDDLRESEADSIAESVQGVSAENVRSWQAKAD